MPIRIGIFGFLSTVLGYREHVKTHQRSSILIDCLKPISAVCLLGSIVLVSSAVVYFGLWHGLWLALLLAVTLIDPVWGLGLLLLGLPFSTGQPMFSRIVVLYSELQFGLILLAWIVWARLHRVPLPLNGRILSWSAPFLLSVLLSGLLSSGPLRALFNSARIWELFVVCWLASAILRNRRSAPSVLQWSLLSAGILCSLIGMTQFQTARWGRIYSLFTNANQFAAYLNLLIPFFIVFAMRLRTRARPLWVCATLLLIFALVSTLSRAGVAAFGCAALVMLYRWLSGGETKGARLGQLRQGIVSNRRPLLLNGGMVLVLLAGILIVPVTRHRVSISVASLINRTDRRIVDNFVQERVPFFRTGWSIWRDNFVLGIGPGNYWEALRERSAELRLYWDVPSFRGFTDNVSTHVHCLYLQLGLNFGILGLTTFLYFLGQALRWLWRESRESGIALAGLGLTVAFASQNLLDVTFPGLGLHTGLLLGWALSRETGSFRI